MYRSMMNLHRLSGAALNQQVRPPPHEASRTRLDNIIVQFGYLFQSGLPVLCPIADRVFDGRPGSFLTGSIANPPPRS
ncbi:hypothetical protein JQ543_28255 [Bradyrhizobium diazoefficiens]|nr:hypothetical protein [Bradyrhizobium diazoefficiens]MBR0777251.1 hypothetical protein [Bradyrhizobium diazoefficiens]MBR0851664.1 hypothetical protein [Bradyrhizobium diazoefficiens]